MEQRWQPKPLPLPPRKSLKDDPQSWERWLHEVFRLLVELHRVLVELTEKDRR